MARTITPQTSIRRRIVASLVGVALVATALTGVLSTAVTRAFFQRYVALHRQERSDRVAALMAQYYQYTGSWSGVDAAIEEFLPQRGWWEMMGHMAGSMMCSMLSSAVDRVVVADASGLVVGDTSDRAEGQRLSKTELALGSDVVVGGRKVGTVIILRPDQEIGGVISDIERDFLRSTLGFTIGAALAVAAIAAGLGLVVSRGLARPLSALVVAVKKIEEGGGKNLACRVPVTGTDEIGQLAEAFNSMLARLEKNEQLRRSMIADLAHELRTPVAVLRGNLEAMQWNLTPVTQERIISLHDEVVRMSRLLQDLQDLAVAEAGELSLNKSDVDFRELVARVAGFFWPEAQSRGIELSFEVEDGAGMVFADADRIRQVLANLLTNALRHTSSGGRVRVTARRSGDEVVVTVADTGEGIDPEDLPHVFDRFYRGRKERPEHLGLGLGLGIAKALVEAHGGRIWAESEKGKGASFHFAIPAKARCGEHRGRGDAENPGLSEV